MQHLHLETRIEAPVEHVWEFYCDTSHWEDFMPRATFSEFSGPVDQVGTTYVSTMRLMGHEMKTTQTVVEVEPLRLIHEHNDDGPMDSYMRFEHNGDATRLIVESDYELPGKLPGFIKAIATKGWVERSHRNMLADFKALAEAKVPAHA
jgi:ligand-binding SRPBCC domain-containing protein